METLELENDTTQVIDDERQVDQKSGIITRHPSPDETAVLMQAVRDQGGDPIDLHTTPTWVAEKDGKIIGCLAARLAFEVLPFPVQSAEGALSIPAGRAEQLLFESCHRWMRSAKNGVGAHYSVTVANDDDTGNLLHRLGWKVVDFAKSKVFARTF
jgi:hypothetical protein